MLDREGRLAPERAAEIATALASALGFAHGHGVIHRDMKPANVLFMLDGRVKLADMGIARLLSPEALTATLTLRGTPRYISPEQARGDPVDSRADLYSLGCVLFEMLTGRTPFEGNLAALSYAHVHTPAPRVRSVDPAIPIAMDELVAAMLEKDPADRPQTGENVRTSLDTAMRPAAVTKTAPMEAVPPAPTRRLPVGDDRVATAGEFGAALRDVAGVATERAAAPARRSGLEETAVVASAPPPPRFSVFRTWFAVPLLVVVIAASALGAGLWLGKLQLGGPVGIRFGPSEEGPAPATRLLRFDTVAAMDPYGDGHENDSGMPLAADDDPLTVWKSENFDGTLNKPGMGMLFDLGSPQTVTGFRLQTPYPGYRFTVVVGDDPTAMAADARPTFTATTEMREPIGPATGRYVLLWITSVVPTDDGNRAEVSEFGVVGPA